MMLSKYNPYGSPTEVAGGGVGAQRLADICAALSIAILLAGCIWIIWRGIDEPLESFRARFLNQLFLYVPILMSALGIVSGILQNSESRTIQARVSLFLNGTVFTVLALPEVVFQASSLLGW